MEVSVIQVADVDGPIVSVDDDSTYQDLLSFAYSRSELDKPLLMFQDGLSCVEYLKQVARGEQPYPAVILMDVNMPVTNGIETTRMIRALTSLGRPPRIVMLSASSHTHDVQQAFEAGADAYLEKPMDLLALIFELAAK